MRTRLADNLIITFFLVALALPGALVLRDLRGRHGEPFKDWFGEHFGLRRQLVAANAWLQLELLSASSSSQVIVGKDRWLFYRGGDALQDFRGLHPFQPHELQAWSETIMSRQRWLAERGIAFLVVIPPNKQTVYPEQAPAWATRVGARTRVDELLEAVHGVEVLDLRKVLLDHKGAAPTYWRTDSHWTPYGAFIGASATLGALQGRFPAIQVPSADDYRLETGSWKDGDLARLLGIPGVLEDPIPRMVAKQAQVFSQEHRSGGPGSTAGELITRSKTGVVSHALILHDSFMKDMIPVLAPAFEQARFVSTIALTEQQVAREEPQVVIWEFAERALNVEAPEPIKAGNVWPGPRHGR